VCGVSQTYRTASLGDPGVVRISSDAWDVEITVDADGMVLDYPGLASRV
jgi:hypothetical protein